MDIEKYFIPIGIWVIVFIMNINTAHSQSGKDTVLEVRKTKDFGISGSGAADNWSKTDWILLSQLKGNKSQLYNTRAKLLYSDKGLYFLFECEDQALNATLNADFEKLWEEDVVEVFLWPDETTPDYFEYELSPLNYELPLLISDRQADGAKWIPFQYHGSSRQTRHKTFVEGGKKKSDASITEWWAEFFIPYTLLIPLNNISPKPGTKWRANLYRIDYDMRDTKWWAWQPIKTSFHEYEKYGVLIFE